MKGVNWPANSHKKGYELEPCSFVIDYVCWDKKVRPRPTHIRVVRKDGEGVMMCDLPLNDSRRPEEIPYEERFRHFPREGSEEERELKRSLAEFLEVA